MRARVDHYDALYQGFRWPQLREFNWFEACCARWARDTPDAMALHCENEHGDVVRHSYAALHTDALRLAAALAALGVARGDRVAVVMPQRFETAVAQMAVSALGGVAMPLSMLFGPDALAYRLRDSEARVAIVDESAIEALLAARGECMALRHIVAVGAAGGRGTLDWAACLRDDHAAIAPVKTLADDAAVLIYTSGTTGPPKGALVPQRALIGNLSGFVCSQNWFPHAAGVFWSPADWAWTGGLMDALLPTLYFGRPIVANMAKHATSGRFSPEKAFELMERYGVTNAFLFPTALKMMMKAVEHPRTQYKLKLRAIMAAGEATVKPCSTGRATNWA